MAVTFTFQAMERPSIWYTT